MLATRLSHLHAPPVSSPRPRLPRVSLRGMVRARPDPTASSPPALRVASPPNLTSPFARPIASPVVSSLSRRPSLPQGNSSTKLEKAIDGHIPHGERYYGLENFGNTCYANSVLQALYFCTPFRDRLLEYYEALPETREENLLTCLGELFFEIASQKKRTGVYAPKRFIARLKHDNELFRSFMHQDAHEFFNYTLNECCEILEREEKRSRRATPPTPPTPNDAPITTWIHDLFQGHLTNQTKCLWCENVTSRDEAFLDLSLDIEQNASVSACLRQFSSDELLANQDKFQCDRCGGLQEANKRMVLKRAPKVLALHLKRFKYVESMGRHSKLMHRVVFPPELRLDNLSEDAPTEEHDASYDLFAVVVHVGSGPNHGHYVSLVRSHGQWLTYDDDAVDIASERDVSRLFGNTRENQGSGEQGYILFYQRRDERGAG